VRRSSSLDRSAELPGLLAAGAYAWAAAVSFGIALLDVVYARLLPGAAAASSRASDLLLLVGGATMLVALGATALCWDSRDARGFFVASLAAGVFGLFAPALLSPILQVGSAWGAGIRLGLAGAVSALALVGFYRLHPGRERPAHQ
jgi:hypothetical protein